MQQLFLDLIDRHFHEILVDLLAQRFLDRGGIIFPDHAERAGRCNDYQFLGFSTMDGEMNFLDQR